MNKKSDNPCIRCGKQRIFSKSWTEEVITFSGSKVKVDHLESVCPDPECQEALEKDFADQKEKRDEIARKKEKKAEEDKAKKGGLRLAKEKK